MTTSDDDRPHFQVPANAIAEATATHDIVTVNIDHLYGAAAGPLVRMVIDCEPRGDTEALPFTASCQLPAMEADQISGDLASSAARAQYEADFMAGAQEAELDDVMVAMIIGLIRFGEAKRAGS